MPQAKPPNPPTPEQPAPAPETPQAEAPAGAEDHLQRLFRAQSIELEAVRRQLQDAPDPEALADLRARAERFDALSADLPEWRQRLAATHQAEVLSLQRKTELQEVQLTTARLEADAQAAFLQAGGNAQHWPQFLQLSRNGITRDESGAVLMNGQRMADTIRELAADPHSIWPSFMRPAYGSGGGARSAREGRAVAGQNLAVGRTPKSDLFRAGFTTGSAQ